MGNEIMMFTSALGMVASLLLGLTLGEYGTEKLQYVPSSTGGSWIPCPEGETSCADTACLFVVNKTQRATIIILWACLVLSLQGQAFAFAVFSPLSYEEKQISAAFSMKRAQELVSAQQKQEEATKASITQTPPYA